MPEGKNLDMRRYEALQEIVGTLDEEPVICNIGHPSRELFMIEDRDQNFYMLGSMGLSSSIGLGLALSVDEPMVAIDGDGSILMNLGSLVTAGVNAPDNFNLVIIDNSSYGSTGFQPTFTQSGIDLQDFVESSSFESVRTITSREKIGPALRNQIDSYRGPNCLIVQVEPGKPEDLPIIDHPPIALKNRIRKRYAHENDH